MRVSVFTQLLIYICSVEIKIISCLTETVAFSTLYRACCVWTCLANTSAFEKLDHRVQNNKQTG